MRLTRHLHREYTEKDKKALFKEVLNYRAQSTAQTKHHQKKKNQQTEKLYLPFLQDKPNRMLRVTEKPKIKELFCLT